MMIDLECYPFCASNHVLFDYESRRVVCHVCGAQSVAYPTRSFAEDAWDKRVPRKEPLDIEQISIIITS